MHWPSTFGWIVFIVVPGGLWLLGAWVNRGHGFWARILGFIVGTDNRLSLSRLQAFLWTLVIFGSYAAATSCRSDIRSGAQAEAQKVAAYAKDAVDKATKAKADANKADTDARSAADAATAAEITSQDAEAYLKYVSAPEARASDADKADAAKKALAARGDLFAKKARADASASAARAAKATQKTAEDEAREKDKLAKSYAWVQIPAALLALAGIAIGSGVFSSLISAAGGEEKTAAVTSISAVANDPNFKATYPKASLPQFANCLVITGTLLGDGGKVRMATKGLTKVLTTVLFWNPDGTQILVDLPPDPTFDKLIVDTPNGKLTYKLEGTKPNYSLGSEKTHYEFADLFRDDKNPETLSLMKFQMFGWTIIAIVIYVFVFLHNLTDQMETLPVVDSSIVALTGLSQAGYLTGKGVSNAKN